MRLTIPDPADFTISRRRGAGERRRGAAVRQGEGGYGSEPGDAPINPEIFYKSCQALKFSLQANTGRKVCCLLFGICFFAQRARTPRAAAHACGMTLGPPTKQTTTTHFPSAASHVRVGGGRWSIECGVCWRGMPSRRDLWANVKKTQRFVGSLVEDEVGWRR